MGIALVNLAQANSMARESARREGVKLDADRELVALGAANVQSHLSWSMVVGAEGLEPPASSL